MFYTEPFTWIDREIAIQVIYDISEKLISDQQEERNNGNWQCWVTVDDIIEQLYENRFDLFQSAEVVKTGFYDAIAHETAEIAKTQWGFHPKYKSKVDIDEAVEDIVDKYMKRWYGEKVTRAKLNGVTSTMLAERMYLLILRYRPDLLSRYKRENEALFRRLYQLFNRICFREAHNRCKRRINRREKKRWKKIMEEDKKKLLELQKTQEFW